MVWMTPKTNWQATDYINAVDFNRLENNIAEVRAYLLSIGYSVDAITIITNRNNASFDYISSINRIENNLDSLQLSYYMPAGWQSKKTWDVTKGFTFQDVNRLENNINLLMDMAQNNVLSIPSCGVAICGGSEVSY
jgi:hypothetical protein